MTHRSAPTCPQAAAPTAPPTLPPRRRFDVSSIGARWDGSVAPGGWVCADCGTPVESEPCHEHWAEALAARLEVVAALLPPVPGPGPAAGRCLCGCRAFIACGVARAVWALHGIDPETPSEPVDQDPLPLAGLAPAPRA